MVVRLLNARYNLLMGDVDAALDWYGRAVSAHNDWKQLHHFCYWEMAWAHLFKLDWAAAREQYDKLLDQSRWSKAIYAYHVAATMCMEDGALTEEQRKRQKQLMT